MKIAVLDDESSRVECLRRALKNLSDPPAIYWCRDPNDGWSPSLESNTKIELFLCHLSNKHWLMENTEDNKVKHGAIDGAVVKVIYSGGGIELKDLPKGWRGIARPLEGSNALTANEWNELINWVAEGAFEDTLPSLLRYIPLNLVIALDILCQCFDIARPLTPGPDASILSTAHMQILAREVTQRSWWARGLAIGELADPDSFLKALENLRNRFDDEGIKGERLIVLTDLCRRVLRGEVVHIEDVKALESYVKYLVQK